MLVRDNRIDFIRALCTLTVIIAHVQAPTILNNIRTFDVISLMFISGMSLKTDSNISYKSYLIKRIKKLLLPTYCMLFFVFFMSFISCKLLGISQLYDKSEIFRSFLLLYKGSMGYVWIVRIYLVIALLFPLIRYLDKKIGASFSYLILYSLICICILYVLLSLGTFIDNDLLSAIYFDYLYSSVAYMIVAQLGVWSKRNIRKAPKLLLILGMLFFVTQSYYAVKGVGFVPSSYKFPPTFYYCIYGLFISLLLYLSLPNFHISYVTWISVNSFSVYLWHIIMLRGIGLLAKISYFRFIDNYWIVKYLLVVLGAILTVILTNALLSRIYRRKKFSAC